MSRSLIHPLPELPDLRVELDRLLAQIPAGAVTSYGDLAEALGDLGAARWVATELAGREEKRVRRRDEMGPAERFTGFECGRPLGELAAWQSRMAGHARFDERVGVPARVGAVDVSYASEREAVAAYAECDVGTRELVRSASVRVPVRFPYIPGYLTFRELPALIALLNEVPGELAPVILVDGSGRLHPRRFGIAVALGVLTGLCTVGVSKHRLCGRAREAEGTVRELWEDGEALGYQVDGGSKRRTMYVSPGQGLNAESALAVVQAVWHELRSPDPIHWADALSRRAC